MHALRQLETCTLCFLKFRAYYAMLQFLNVKQIMLIVLHLYNNIMLSVYSILHVSTYHNIWIHQETCSLCYLQLHISMLWTDKLQQLLYTRFDHSLNAAKSSCTHEYFIQHYAGITNLPIMPKAMPAYCACPYFTRILSSTPHVNSQICH